MYIPKAYKSENRKDAIQFIRNNSFGLLVSSASKLCGTHLPFLIEEEGNKLQLLSHLALFNPQVNELEEKEVLVVFQGPHAYISPFHYERKDSVPTWNYLSAHVKGQVKFIKEKETLMSLLDKTVGFYDYEYQKQWKNISESYMKGVLKALVGIQIQVSSIEYCEKLSQDRSEYEQKNIIEHLLQSSNSNEKNTGERMKVLLTS